MAYTWKESWQDVDQFFQKAMREAVKYGDHYQISLAGCFMFAFKADISLTELIDGYMEAVPEILRTKNTYGKYMTFMFLNRYMNYAGMTEDRYSLSISEDTYNRNGKKGICADEEECRKVLEEMNSLSGLGVFYKEKMFLHYFYEDNEKAGEYLQKSDFYLKYHTGTPYVVECTFCNFLVAAANLNKMNQMERWKAELRMRKDLRTMKKWVKSNPQSFLHLKYMMEAELCRMNRKWERAGELYELSILSSGRNRFYKDRALACELAAKMYLETGEELQAAYYLGEAYNGYKNWGAIEKTRFMEEKYAKWIGLTAEHTRTEKSGRQEEPADRDFESVMNAYQAISSIVDLSDLLLRIIEIVVENSGARRAVVLLQHEGEWTIEADWKIDDPAIKILQHQPISGTEENLAVSVVNYCVRMKEIVLLDNAMKQGIFFRDSYIRNHKMKSLLCMPIENLGEMIGMLYLENEIMEAVFTRKQIQLFQLLSGQFAVSIKNVRLFSDLLSTTENLHLSKEESLRSEIAFLQAQIKPHFLYNAINTISAFSLDNSEMTRELLANLSEYLRSSFDFKNRDKLVSLNKELSLVEAYLFIEKARFGERLKITYDLDESIECILPPISIQPLVENAVQHGVSERREGGEVRISVYRESTFIFITVEDDGEGLPQRLQQDIFTSGSGVALKNINLRFLRLYGYGLSISQSSLGGVKAELKIPVT